jgi:AcrR family transcriptional regulator
MLAMSTPTGPKRRPGRPQKTDSHGIESSQRLLTAATDACIEHGFEAIRMSDIARRAGITTASVYTHYASKSELLVAAARQAFDIQVRELRFDRLPVAGVLGVFLSPQMRATRRLVVELHSAATRHADIAEMLAAWHDEVAERSRPFVAGKDPDAAVKAFFILLLGLCHLDDLKSVPASSDSLARTLEGIVDSLFDSPGRSVAQGPTPAPGVRRRRSRK